MGLDSLDSGLWRGVFSGPGAQVNVGKLRLTPQAAVCTTGALGRVRPSESHVYVCVRGAHAGGRKRDPPWRGWGDGSDARSWRLRAIVGFWARVISVSVALRGSAVRCLRAVVLPMCVVKKCEHWGRWSLFGEREVVAG